MSAVVPLRFIAPDIPGLTELKVWEASSSDGVFAQIDSTTEIGTYPDYITSFTTILASSSSDWFAISWVEANADETALSPPVQGSASSLVDDVVSRTLQRDPSLNPFIALQEAEAAIEQYFGADPYSVDPTGIAYQVLNGLVYLTLANCYLVGQAIEADSESVTMGMVSLRTNAATTTPQAIEQLLQLANMKLGLNTSVVLQLRNVQARISCEVYEA